MRPSLVHDASTFGESRAFRSKSTRRLVRFSVMTMCVPLSFRLLVKTALRGSYDVNLTITGRGLRVPADSGEVRPMRWLRSMQPASRCTPTTFACCFNIFSIYQAFILLFHKALHPPSTFSLFLSGICLFLWYPIPFS